MPRRFVSAFVVLLLAIALAPAAFAAKAAPAQCTVTPMSGFGVSPDIGGTYIDGVGGVRCYLGVNGKDANLVTYNSGRTLHFVFNPGSAAYVASKIGGTGIFDSEVDLFGINYFGPYRTMAIGSIARVQMDLEFYVGRITYELDYQNLAAIRQSLDTWLITSIRNDVCPNWDCSAGLGFTPSSQADLNVIRRRSVETFGQVEMPIRFEIKMK